MMFDTGSCEFWIPSAECKTTRCLVHNTYSKSSSYRLKKKDGMEI